MSSVAGASASREMGVWIAVRYTTELDGANSKCSIFVFFHSGPAARQLAVLGGDGRHHQAERGSGVGSGLVMISHGEQASVPGCAGCCQPSSDSLDSSPSSPRRWQRNRAITENHKRMGSLMEGYGDGVTMMADGTLEGRGCFSYVLLLLELEQDGGVL